jgi:hypothetical protein
MTANAFHNIAQIETSLWEAADQLRANLTATEYSMPVLGVGGVVWRWREVQRCVVTLDVCCHLLLQHTLGFGQVQRSRDVDAIIKRLLKIFGFHQVPSLLCVRDALMVLNFS